MTLSVTISFPACCVSHRATGLPVMVHDMHTRRRRPDYLQACPTEPPVDGVKSALTSALLPCAVLWPCTFCSDRISRVPGHGLIHFGLGLEKFLWPRPHSLCAALWPCTFCSDPRNHYMGTNCYKRSIISANVLSNS